MAYVTRPCAATDAAASSEAARGTTFELTGGSFSVRSWPDPAFPIPVPEVTINSLSELASTVPKASMTRRSASQFAANFVKS